MEYISDAPWYKRHLWPEDIVPNVAHSSGAALRYAGADHVEVALEQPRHLGVASYAHLHDPGSRGIPRPDIARDVLITYN